MATQKLSVEQLKALAKSVRQDIVRMTCKAGSGHPGGSLSVADLLVALYFSKLNYDPSNPHWEERDIFILSKGHVCPALYSVLAEAGYFSKEELLTLRQIDSKLQGHPCRSLAGIEISSGSLGQGLSVATGAALAYKIDKKTANVFCITGDGELQEGQIWEAAMTAAHYKLDNLTCIVDKNDLQIDGKVEEVMNINPITDKFRAFNWHVLECDGHNMEEILEVYDKAIANKGKPTCIIAKTVKGKGVSFMENDPGWHGKAPTEEQCEIALKELA